MSKMIECIARSLCSDPDASAGWLLQPERKLWENHVEEARRVLETLRDFDVMSLELENPQPMFFGDAWVEVFDAALAKEPSPVD